jgi:hypothetical protein
MLSLMTQIYVFITHTYTLGQRFSRTPIFSFPLSPCPSRCLSSHVQSDRSRDDEGEVACWKADVSMSGMCCDTRCFGAIEDTVVLALAVGGGFDYRDASCELNSPVPSRLVCIDANIVRHPSNFHHLKERKKWKKKSMRFSGGTRLPHDAKKSVDIAR